MNLRWLPVFLVGWLLAGCASLPERVEPLRVSVAEMSLVDIGLLELRFDLKLRVRNPNAVAVPVEAISYEIEINDYPFASGSALPKTEIPAQGEALIDATAVSPLLSILRQAFDLRSLPERIKYRMRGRLTFTMGMGSVPFDLQGEIPLPKKPREPSPETNPPASDPPADGSRRI